MSKKKPVKLTTLDKAIGWISPAHAYRRAQYRHALNMYEGASRSRRLRDWRTTSTSINEATRTGLEALRARARHLSANNAHAHAAHRELAANIVGTGITPHVRLDCCELRAPGEQLIDDYFDTSDCDVAGRSNLYGLQQQAVKTMVESGSVILRRVKRRPVNRAGVRQLPIQLQVLEPDYIDLAKNGKNGNNTIVQGVEYDRSGRVVAYWLHDHHPGDTTWMSRSWESRRHNADDIIHMYRTDRPGQVHGVPWGAPVIIRLRDWDEYSDAQLYRQKIAACFTAFVIPGDQFGLGIHGQQAASDETDLPERLEPGMIESLAGGKDVKFASPPVVEGFNDYSMVTLHEIAAGYGVPYSILTGDLRQVNFSSGRMGDRAFSRNVQQWQQHIVIPQMCDKIWRWTMEAALAVRLIDQAVPARWAPPRRELTDPAREIPAIRDAVRAGLMTLPEAIRRQGYDPDDVLAEVRSWNELMDDAGLVFDSDPRKVSAAGLTQSRGDNELPPTGAPDK